MDNSIILKVSDLRTRVQELRRDGIEYVELSIMDSYTDPDDELIPSSLEFSGCKFNEPDFWFDYEGLEAVENSDELQEQSLSSPHGSSNLI